MFDKLWESFDKALHAWQNWQHWHIWSHQTCPNIIIALTFGIQHVQIDRPGHGFAPPARRPGNDGRVGEDGAGPAGAYGAPAQFARLSTLAISKKASKYVKSLSRKKKKRPRHLRATKVCLTWFCQYYNYSTTRTTYRYRYCSISDILSCLFARFYKQILVGKLLTRSLRVT